MTFRRLTLLLGAMALVHGGHAIGWSALAAGVARIGLGGWAALLGLQSLAFAADAWALARCAGPWSRELTFARCLRACVVAQAVNTVTPLGQLGELHKARRLPASWPTAIRAGTVLLHNHVMFVGTCASVALGLVVGAHCLEGVPAGFGRWAWVGASLCLVAAAGAHLALVHGHDLFARLRHHVGKLGGRSIPARWAAVGRAGAAIDEAALAARRLCGSHLPWSALGATLFKRALLVLEIVLVLRRLGCPASAPLALLSSGGSQLVAWGTSFVPAQLGTAEVGSALLFQTVGASAAMGLTLEVVRRGRRLLVAAIGLTLA